MRASLIALAALFVIAAASGRAAAYPQFQLTQDQTCTGCHLSPAGGNLLNENGLAVAESMSQLGTAPEFFYGKVPTPGWLTLGGDLRGAAGFISTPEKVLASFPMQIELYAAATYESFSLHVNFGPRPSQFGNRAATSVWAREHYLMWQQEAGGSSGVYVRAGRFMPVFGLRLAEHPVYVRRFGGTPLYAETYGAHVAYVDPKFEIHATGFIEDPLISPVAHDNGAALYAELRVSPTAAVGGEFMFTDSEDDKKIRAGAIGKLAIPAANLLLQTEIQFVNQVIDTTPTNPVGGAPVQLVGYLLGSLTLNDFLLLDIGVGHYDSNVRIKEMDRDSVDVNLHYFLTSHVELSLTNRFEMIGLGKGGPSSGYSLVQLHYRL
ncbi:MAG: hypothetical protein JWP01_3704 [Myxococcales bacterium]|nr:hypothetical protein [Myxococcales bacterium]